MSEGKQAGRLKSDPALSIESYSAQIWTAEVSDRIAYWDMGYAQRRVSRYLGRLNVMETLSAARSNVPAQKKKRSQISARDP